MLLSPMRPALHALPPLAITDARRLLLSLRFPGLILQVFNGLFSAAHTPSTVISKIADVTKAALSDPSFRSA